MSEKFNNEFTAKTVRIIKALILESLTALLAVLIFSGCSESESTPKTNTKEVSQNETVKISYNTNSQQYEDWNYTSWIDGDRKASKITPTELTDKNMTFIFLDEPENGKVVKLRVMRISAETEYFVGQHGMLSDDHRDQIFNVELEKISDGCYIGVIANRKNTNTTQMRIAKPGIDCQR